MPRNHTQYGSHNSVNALFKIQLQYNIIKQAGVYIGAGTAANFEPERRSGKYCLSQPALKSALAAALSISKAIVNRTCKIL